MDLCGLLVSRQPQLLTVDKSYVHRLGELPCSLVESEIVQLEASRQAVDSALGALGASKAQELAQTKRAFLKTAELLEQLNKAVALFPKQERTLSKPIFDQAAETRAQEGALLESLDLLQDLLAVPSLISACVSSHQYAAALDVAALASRISERYPTSATASRIANTQGAVDIMRARLVRQLLESSRLPQLVRAVGLLRRVRPLSDADAEAAQLPRVFLASRSHFILKQIQTLELLRDPENPAPYLRRFIELIREHVFATMTTFSSVFAHDSAYLLPRFARKAIALVQRELLLALPKLSSEERASIWLQLAYCSQSLGRLGADFLPLLCARALSEEYREEALKVRAEMAATAANLRSDATPAATTANLR